MSAIANSAAVEGSGTELVENVTGGEGLTMQAAIGYLRISTRKQGRSGLGLAAQRCEIEAFGAQQGFSVKSW